MSELTLNWYQSREKLTRLLPWVVIDRTLTTTENDLLQTHLRQLSHTGRTPYDIFPQRFIIDSPNISELKDRVSVEVGILVVAIVTILNKFQETQNWEEFSVLITLLERYKDETHLVELAKNEHEDYIVSQLYSFAG